MEGRVRVNQASLDVLRLAQVAPGGLGDVEKVQLGAEIEVLGGVDLGEVAVDVEDEPGTAGDDGLSPLGDGTGNDGAPVDIGGVPDDSPSSRGAGMDHHYSPQAGQNA